MEFLAQCAECNFEVFENRIRLVLPIEGVLARPCNSVLCFVEHTAEAAGLSSRDQLTDRVGVQHRLHELLGSLEIEERPRCSCGAHLENATLLIPQRVGLCTRRDLNDRIVSAENALHHLFRKVENFLGRARITLF